ncbi:MAG: hypothetical protein ACRDZN_09055 [Acidimicrobiales bacterium]
MDNDALDDIRRRADELYHDQPCWMRAVVIDADGTRVLCRRCRHHRLAQ